MMSRAPVFLSAAFTVVLFAVFWLDAKYDRPAAMQEDPSDLISDTRSFADSILQNSAKDIVFLENLGQIGDTKGETRPDVLFLTRSEGVDMYITDSGITYVFRISEIDSSDQSRFTQSEIADKQTERSFYRLDMEFVDANRDITIRKELAVDQQYHYYTPDFPDGISPRAYKKLTIENLYDGIDLVYYEQGGRMKYDFILKAGADPGRIQMRYEGASSLDIDAEGRLTMTTPLGEIREEKPFTYSRGTGSEIESRYRLQGNTVLFDIAAYDQKEDIIIDPVRVWATFYGGNDSDLGWSLCTDNSGNLYVTGRTSSSNFPVQSWSGAYDQTTSGGGNRDAFILKFNSSGERIWAVYYGGNDHDVAWGICADPSGNIYIAGRTASEDFPTQTLEGAYNQTTYGGGHRDAFILKFNSSGERQWATYYGGDAEDVGWSLSPDRSGNVYVVGRTASEDFPTQILQGAYNQTTYGGGEFDAFILKFDSSGIRQWATYYGGTGTEERSSIFTDSSATIYITGQTSSNDFPVQIREGAYNQINYGGGDFDACILKFDTNGTRQWATYYGGNGDDQGWGICTDHSANLYVTGTTGSVDFPTQILEEAFNQLYFGGGESDAFILKFDSNAARQWATYCGGSETDLAHGLCTDQSGNLYIIGRTESIDFPTGASTGDFYQETLLGNNDVFIMQFDISGFPQWSTYYGGGGSDWGESIVMDDARNLYATGATWSGSFPTHELSGAYNQDTHAGGFNDVFLLKFDVGPLVATNDIRGTRSDNNILDLSVYPNPASDFLTIRYRLVRKSELLTRITDINGVKVYGRYAQSPADIQEHRIDVSQLPAGTYLLHLGSEGQSVTRKIAIVR